MTTNQLTRLKIKYPTVKDIEEKYKNNTVIWFHLRINNKRKLRRVLKKTKSKTHLIRKFKEIEGCTTSKQYKQFTHYLTNAIR